MDKNVQVSNSAQIAQNQLLPAVIVNTSGWVNHWFEGMEGTKVVVKKYPYKSTIGGFIDSCGCVDCVINRAGRKLYETYEIVEGYEKVGPIIPECCLSFNGR